MPQYRIEMGFPHHNTYEIVNLVMAFIKDTKHKDVNVDPDVVYKWIKSLQEDGENNVLFLMLDENDAIWGFIIGVHSVNPFFTIDSMATEVIWYVHPEHRGKSSIELFKAFDAWASTFDYVGVSYLPGGPDLSKIYESFGYEIAEICYRKVNKK